MRPFCPPQCCVESVPCVSPLGSHTCPLPFPLATAWQPDQQAAAGPAPRARCSGCSGSLARLRARVPLIDEEAERVLTSRPASPPAAPADGLPDLRVPLPSALPGRVRTSGGAAALPGADAGLGAAGLRVPGVGAAADRRRRQRHPAGQPHGRGRFRGAAAQRQPPAEGPPWLLRVRRARGRRRAAVRGAGGARVPRPRRPVGPLLPPRPRAHLPRAAAGAAGLRRRRPVRRGVAGAGHRRDGGADIGHVPPRQGGAAGGARAEVRPLRSGRRRRAAVQRPRPWQRLLRVPPGPLLDRGELQRGPSCSTSAATWRDCWRSREEGRRLHGLEDRRRRGWRCGGVGPVGCPHDLLGQAQEAQEARDDGTERGGRGGVPDGAGRAGSGTCGVRDANATCYRE
jgi:hypothetical protein